MAWVSELARLLKLIRTLKFKETPLRKLLQKEVHHGGEWAEFKVDS